MRLPLTVFRTGNPVDAVWRAAIAVSSFLAVLVLLLFPAINHEYDARMARDAARAPVDVFDGAPQRGEVIGYWGADGDQASGHEVSIARFLPVGSPSLNPPGVAEWPGPGEVYASPEVLATPGGADLVARYGKLVGEIDPSVLADRKERTLYVGVDPQVLDAPVFWLPVTGFGMPVDRARGDAGMFGSAQYQSARSGALLLALAFGLAPLLVLVFVLARLGGERRDATASLLVALGAGRKQIRSALWRTARAPLAVGATLAAGLAFALGHLLWTVPYTGYPMTPSPDGRQALELLACTLGGAGLTWLALWVGTRPRNLVFVSTRPAAAPRVPSSRPVVALLATLALINWLYAFVSPANPTFGAVVLFVGMLLCILLLAPATSSILTALAGAVVALSRRRGGATALVVGRELSFMARSAVRATVFMGIVALTATFATVVATQPNDILRQAQAASSINAGQSVGFETSETATWLPRLASSLPAHEHLVQLTQGLGVEDVRITAPCDTQVALLDRCAGEGAATLGSVATTAPASLRAWGASPSTLVATGEVGAGQVLVVTDDGTRVDTAGLADVLRTLVSPVPRLSEPGSSWLVGAGVAVRQSRWIVVVGALACLFAVVMGSATLLTEVVRMRRRHRVFAIYAGGFARHLGLGAGLVGLPLVLGGAVGGATGYFASYTAIHLGNASDRSAGSLVLALLTLVLVVASLSSLMAAVATARAASARFTSG